MTIPLDLKDSTSFALLRFLRLRLLPLLACTFSLVFFSVSSFADEAYTLFDYPAVTQVYAINEADGSTTLPVSSDVDVQLRLMWMWDNYTRYLNQGNSFTFYCRGNLGFALVVNNKSDSWQRINGASVRLAFKDSMSKYNVAGSAAASVKLQNSDLSQYAPLSVYLQSFQWNASANSATIVFRLYNDNDSRHFFMMPPNQSMTFNFVLPVTLSYQRVSSSFNPWDYTSPFNAYFQGFGASVVPADPDSSNQLVEQSREQYEDFTSSGDAVDGSNPAVDSASDVMKHLDEEGLGSQITAIASDIMGVFGAEGVPDATLTLPALRLTVQGVEYEVWSAYTFDFAMLDTWGFSALMSAVRFATVAAVYLALFKYMIALIDSIVEDRALEMVISEAD